MNKQLTKELILLLLCILGLSLACSLTSNSGDDRKVLRNPSDLSSYNPKFYPEAELGYFRIDPETILTKLEQGETDVFQPLLEDPQLVEEIPGISISWTQADFLNIANALGQLVWADSMNFEDWKVDYILLAGSCRDTSMGFHSADITYYKTVDVNGKKAYVTRLIGIDPYFGMVRWGGGAIYPQSSTSHWNGVDLSQAKITADEAFRIAEENGGRELRLQADNKCGVMISSPRHGNNEHWFLTYIIAGEFWDYEINLYTGEILGEDH